jgi:archaellum component FlaC
LLTTAATLERGYQMSRKSGSQLQIKEMDELYRQWLSDVDSFKNSLRAQGAEPKALEYVNEGLNRLAERIKKLAG